MYDPVLGRFVSADSVVPGAGDGRMAGIALKPLTVDVHETGFVATLAQENQQPFWFQMDYRHQQSIGSLWGPENPQALNRYSYVLNNPLTWKDPSGHIVKREPYQSSGKRPSAPPPPPKKTPSISNPMKGAPGSKSTTYQDNGAVKQERVYGSDGYPEYD